MLGIFLMQMDAEVAADVDRIALALTIVAAAVVITGLALAFVLIKNLSVLNSVQKLIHNTDERMNRLLPQLGPLVDKTSGIASDAQEMTERLKSTVTDLTETLDRINRSVRDARHEGERRVREFVAVVDVVKAEAEEILMDAAATARGVHVTAQALRGELPADGARLPASERPARPAGRAERTTVVHDTVEAEPEPVSET